MSPARTLLAIATIIATLVISAHAGDTKTPCIVFAADGPNYQKEIPKNYTAKFEFFDKDVLDHLAEINIRHMCTEVLLTEVYEQLSICYVGALRFCEQWFWDAGNSSLAPLPPLDPVCFPDLRYTDTQYCQRMLKHLTRQSI